MAMAKINNTGTAVLAATYLGTSEYETYILDLDNKIMLACRAKLGNYLVAMEYIQILENNLFKN